MDPISICNNWQLFIDDHVVARSTGFSRVVHHPRPYGVVIPADKPWETCGIGGGHIDQRPDGSFFCYYSAMWWDAQRGSKLEEDGFRRDRAHHIFNGMAYATSEDGIHWDKPELSLVEGPAETVWEQEGQFALPAPKGTSKQNNLGAPFAYVVDLGRHGNVTDQARRYAVRLAAPAGADVGCGWRHAPRGYFCSELPDFLNDPNWRDSLVDSGSNFDPRRSFLHFWDDMHQEWVAMEQGASGNWLPSREIARFASTDLLHWHSQGVLYPDAEDSHRLDRYDEPMSLAPFCSDGVVLGLLSWFHSDRSHPDGGPNLEATSEHPELWPWVRKGTNEIRITISRDGGCTWDRTASREAWIPHGTEQDSYDRLAIGAGPPLRVGDEDWFYVGVISGDHLSTRNTPEQEFYYHDRNAKHQVALYRQKHHRYVSLTAHNQTEILISKPLMLDGESLELNVDASRGKVEVAVASAEPIMTFDGTTPSTAPHLLPGHIHLSDGANGMLPGFTFHDCEPIYANSVQHKVKFKNDPDFRSLEGKPVCLLFRMMDADLYGFRTAQHRPINQ